MLQHTFIFVGLVAAAAAFLTLRTADDEIAIISGLIGTIAWLLWGYSALNVVVYDGSGNPLSSAYPSLTAFGVLMAIPCLFVALTGPLRIARSRDQLAKEMQ